MAPCRSVFAIALLVGLCAQAVRAQPVYLAIPNPQAGSTYGFGRDVAAYGDDILVGDYTSSKVYLYDGDTGVLLRTFVSPQVDDGFGYSVAAVGTNVLVGAPYDDTGGDEWGAAYLFDGATGALLHTIINPGPDYYGHFGWAVAASGVDLLIGSPGSYPDIRTAYLYGGSTGALLQTFDSIYGFVGFGTAIADVAGKVAVSSPYDAPGGAVYIYDRASGALLQTLVNPDSVANQAFGWQLRTFGTNLVVGSRPYCCGIPDYAAYLFDPSTAALLATYPLPGPTYSIDVHGGNVLVGTDYAALILDAATGATLRTFLSPGEPEFLDTGAASVGGKVVVGSNEFLQDRAGIVYSFCGGLTECGPCETCDPMGACVTAPHPTCRAPLSGRSTLVVRDLTPNGSDLLVWQLSGAFVDAPRDNPGTLFGRPALGTLEHDYTLCMYDQSTPTPTLIFEATAPADGDCGGRPCWAELGFSRAGEHHAGYSYIDAERTPHGMERVRLQTTSGSSAKFKVLAKGDNLSASPLGMVTPPLNVPLRVQLQNRRGYCWETTYPSARRNVDGLFRATSRVP